MAAGGRRPEGASLPSPADEDGCPAEAPAAADHPAAAPPPPPPLELPPAFSHRVPHFQQVDNWDCGLACVLMVLRALGMRHHNMATLQRLCSTHSIWTIDLAHLLAACGAHVQMLTVTIGANQAYSGERFYAEHMPSDSDRVEELFKAAPAAGIPVHQRSLPLADLKALLLGGTCLPLVLVDKITLGSATAAHHSSWQVGQYGGGGEGGGGEGDGAGAVLARHSPCPSSSGGGAGATASAAAAAAAAAAGQDEVAMPAPAAGGPGGPHTQQPAAAAVPAASSSQPWQGVPMPPAARIESPVRRISSAVATAVAAGSPAALEGTTLSCPGSPVGYLGHYVVLVGYDARSDEFEYRDPSSDRARLWVPAQRLEAARKCFGTDEDLLLVEVPSGSACCASAGSGSSDGGAEGGEAAPAAAAAAADEVSDAAASVQQHRQQQHRQQQQQQQQQPPDDWGAAEAGPYVVYG